MKLLMFALIAALLAGCSTLQPATVDGLDGVAGDELPGAQGKTPADQDRIDDTVARLCAVEIYTRRQCDRHTNASHERFLELKASASTPTS